MITKTYSFQGEIAHVTYMYVRYEKEFRFKTAVHSATRKGDKVLVDEDALFSTGWLDHPKVAHSEYMSWFRKQYPATKANYSWRKYWNMMKPSEIQSPDVRTSEPQTTEKVVSSTVRTSKRQHVKNHKYNDDYELLKVDTGNKGKKAIARKRESDKGTESQVLSQNLSKRRLVAQSPIEGAEHHSENASAGMDLMDLDEPLDIHDQSDNANPDDDSESSHVDEFFKFSPPRLPPKSRASGSSSSGIAKTGSKKVPTLPPKRPLFPTQTTKAKKPRKKAKTTKPDPLQPQVPQQNKAPQDSLPLAKAASAAEPSKHDLSMCDLSREFLRDIILKSEDLSKQRYWICPQCQHPVIEHPVQETGLDLGDFSQIDVPSITLPDEKADVGQPPAPSSVVAPGPGSALPVKEPEQPELVDLQVALFVEDDPQKETMIRVDCIAVQFQDAAPTTDNWTIWDHPLLTAIDKKIREERNQSLIPLWNYARSCPKKMKFRFFQKTKGAKNTLFGSQVVEPRYLADWHLFAEGMPKGHKIHLLLPTEDKSNVNTEQQPLVQVQDSKPQKKVNGQARPKTMVKSARDEAAANDQDRSAFEQKLDLLREVLPLLPLWQELVTECSGWTWDELFADPSMSSVLVGIAHNPRLMENRFEKLKNPTALPDHLFPRVGRSAHLRDLNYRSLENDLLETFTQPPPVSSTQQRSTAPPRAHQYSQGSSNVQQRAPVQQNARVSGPGQLPQPGRGDSQYHQAVPYPHGAPVQQNARVSVPDQHPQPVRGDSQYHQAVPYPHGAPVQQNVRVSVPDQHPQPGRRDSQYHQAVPYAQAPRPRPQHQPYAEQFHENGHGTESQRYQVHNVSEGNRSYEPVYEQVDPNSYPPPHNGITDIVGEQEPMDEAARGEAVGSDVQPTRRDVPGWLHL